MATDDDIDLYSFIWEDEQQHIFDEKFYVVQKLFGFIMNRNKSMITFHH